MVLTGTVQHPFWGDVSFPADAKRRTGLADLLKRAVRRVAVSLGTKAQGMSGAGVVRMLSFVIIGIFGYGLILILRLSPRAFEPFLTEHSS